MLMRQSTVANIRHRTIWYGGYRALPWEEKVKPGPAQLGSALILQEGERKKDTFPIPIS